MNDCCLKLYFPLCVYNLQIVTFWIAGTILIAILTYFICFSLLSRINTQVLYWVKGAEYMEEVRCTSHLSGFIYVMNKQGWLINFVSEQDNQLAVAIIKT